MHTTSTSDIQMPTATQEPEQILVSSSADVDKMTIAELIKRKNRLIESKKKKVVFDAEAMEKRLLEQRRKQQEDQIWAKLI